MMRSLILIGHGSHLNGESAVSVYHYAELLRGRGPFDEVIEGYWKEEPSLRQVLRTATYTDVTVIPMFISEGYFTETVIPRELGLGHQGRVPAGGIARTIGGKTVRYTLPYGVHPAMTDVILARASEALPDHDPASTALVVIGHGTTRNENSNRVIFENAARVRETGRYSEVHALFLDEEPRLSSWQDRVQAKTVVMVPFFASEGWHTLETIPEDLGLTGDVTTFGDVTVYYSRPTGTHELVADVVLQLAEEAHSASDQGGEPDEDHTLAWTAFMERARAGLRMGEALITPEAGVFEVRHALDEGLPGHTLTTVVTPEGVRDLTRRTEIGEHRPVHTLRNLPRGWRAMLSPGDLPRAVHYLYPAVVEESYACSHHALRSTPWATTARRQTGIYAKVQQARPEQVAEVSAKVCTACLKTRLWAGDKLEATFFDGVPGGIPCAEACTLLVAEVRDAISVPRPAPEPIPVPAD